MAVRLALALLASACGRALPNAPGLRGAESLVAHGVSKHNLTGGVGPSCQCVPDAAWPLCQRPAAENRCVFVDLGAAHGNSFQEFLQNKFGPVGNCPHNGRWEAYLVEANPQFTPQLEQLEAQYGGWVHALGSTAAYNCKGQTSFALDPDASHNHWGSSMKAQVSGNEVTVPTVNVMELLRQHTIQGDWVILKVDIEGAEFDLIPCLAQSPSKSLVDIIFLEEHPWLQQHSHYTPQQFTDAKAALQQAGVLMPQYFSHTF